MPTAITLTMYSTSVVACVVALGLVSAEFIGGVPLVPPQTTALVADPAPNSLDDYVANWSSHFAAKRRPFEDSITGI